MKNNILIPREHILSRSLCERGGPSGLQRTPPTLVSEELIHLNETTRHRKWCNFTREIEYTCGKHLKLNSSDLHNLQHFKFSFREKTRNFASFDGIQLQQPLAVSRQQ